MFVPGIGYSPKQAFAESLGSYPLIFAALTVEK